MITSELKSVPISSTDMTEKKYVSLFGTVMTLLNTILGAGVLSIANSFTFCGIVPSIFILTLVTSLSYISAVIVIQLQMKTKVENLDALAKLTTGTIGSIVLQISNIIFCYSCMMTYLIMGTEFIISWLAMAGVDASGRWPRALVALIFSLGIPVACSVPRKLSVLSWISTMALFALAFYTVAVIIEGGIRLPRDGIHPTAETINMNLGIFNALAIYSLSFALAVAVVPIIIHSEPNLTTRYRIIGLTFFFSYVIVMIPGAIGYLIFGNESNPIILLSFGDNIIFLLVKIGYFVVLSASYPAIGLTVLTTVSRTIYKVDDAGELPWRKRIVALVIENLIPVLVAMFFPNVRFAMTIGGSLGGSLSNFLFPPLYYIILSKKRWYHWLNILLIIMATFGVIAAAIATYQAVVDAIQQFKSG